MKAWIVSDEYDEYSTVVFAETRNQAKVEAMATDCCGEMDYIRIQPRRFKEADKMYRGTREMDWYDPTDRRFLCEHGWSCVEVEYDDYDDCLNCSASDVCDKYNDYLIDSRQRLDW